MTQTNVKRLSNYVKLVSIPQGDARLKLRFECLTWLWDVWHALSLDSNVSNMSNLIRLSQDSKLSQTIRFANSNAYQTPSTLNNTASILTGHNTCSLIEGGRNAPLCVTRSHPISPARTLYQNMYQNFDTVLVHSPHMLFWYCFDTFWYTGHTFWYVD